MKRLFSVAALLLASLPARAQAPIRVRCGTTASYTDTAGNVWMPDAGLFNSGSQTYSVSHAITGTADAPLFQTERWNTPHLTYAWTGLANGTYTVTVNLAEVYFSSSGQRVMSIAMQGAPAFSAIDIFKEVGSYAADVKTAAAIVTNGTLTIDMTATVNNPKCGSIAIVPAAPPPPPPANIPLAINPGSTALYDDGTVILAIPVGVQEQEGATSVNIGTVSSDASGNLSGAIAVNPNFADASGNLTFIFSIMGIPTSITYIVPVAEFQQGSTGLTLNLVLFKKALLVKSQTIALTP